MKSFNLVFCNRNDGYASNQNKRIECFIEYYSQLQKHIPTIHLTVIDWNPPEGKAPLEEAFEWNKLRNVKHILVSAEEHQRRFPHSKRQINDYTGRNIGIERSECDFDVILNQDIFISESYFREIDAFSDFGSYYFRSDRQDVEESVLESNDSIFDREIIKTHERLYAFPLSCFIKEGKSVFFESNIDGHIVQRFSYDSVFFKAFIKVASCCINLFLSKANKLTELDLFFFHMNACGDFLVIPRNKSKEFSNIRYPETDEFYMHTDGYILIEMARRGLKQVILRGDEGVRHIDHSRPDRSQDTPYSYHKKQFLEILKN
jgi:hypothetical protein